MSRVVSCGNYHLRFVTDTISFGNCYPYSTGSTYTGSYDTVFSFICPSKKSKNVDVSTAEVDALISDMFPVNPFVREVSEECTSEE